MRWDAMKAVPRAVPASGIKATPYSFELTALHRRAFPDLGSDNSPGAPQKDLLGNQHYIAAHVRNEAGCSHNNGDKDIRNLEPKRQTTAHMPATSSNVGSPDRIRPVRQLIEKPGQVSNRTLHMFPKGTRT